MEADSKELLIRERLTVAQRRWRWFALAVPASILLGEVLYGTFSSLAVHWFRLSNMFAVGLVIGIVFLRTVRRLWLKPLKSYGKASMMSIAMVDRESNRFQITAWTFASIVALMALSLFWMAAPRMYAYVFEIVAIVYLLLYYPRRSFYDELFWIPG